ncbi:MAG: hypothetical protein QOF78_3437 [Phycisphaerales bacterium]|jgi:hypothetical protein|nr:hypothetical protein [Phycisphaerales bacterium]
MSLPAALTWLQLLPNGTQFSCATGPAWFRELLPHRNAGDAPPRATVLWDKSWSEIAGALESWESVVAINCRQVTPAKLESAGYPYVRRFAVLPNLENARWFISLDSGKAAAASFSLYTPSRKSAHLKKAAAKLFARLRLPGWYRDEIVIASRRPSPLETKLAELFANQTVRVALSSGAPEPAINRKPSASVIDADGHVLAFVKIAASKVSREIVEHEAEILAALAQHRHLQVDTPRLLFAGEVDGRYLTVQSPLEGTPAPAAWTSEHTAFLDALSSGPEKMAADTNMVADLPQRLAAQPALRDVFDAILPTLEQTKVKSTIVHGDFAPWNLRTHNGKLSAFDWEYGDVDGLPLIDEIHFRLQLGLEMETWNLDAAVRFMHDMKHEAFDAEQIRAIQAVYLLDNLARLLGEGYSPEHEMVALYQALLARLNILKREAALV